MNKNVRTENTHSQLMCVQDFATEYVCSNEGGRDREDNGGNKYKKKQNLRTQCTSRSNPCAVVVDFFSLFLIRAALY